MTVYLVAVDETACARRAFDLVCRMCRPVEDLIVLVTISDDSVVELMEDELVKTEMREDILLRATRVLEEYVSMARERRIRHTHFVSEASDVRQGMLRIVQTHKADVIALGCRSLGALGRFLLGSTSDFLLHELASNILVVH